jgi:transcriptional regulator with GAF, ATPase, and Fis domain
MVSVDLGVLGAGCAQLVRASGDRQSAQGVLTDVASLMTEVVESCHAASVTVLDDAGPHTAAASSDDVRHLDSSQYETGAGPCLTAVGSGETVVVGDLHADARWPALVAALDPESDIRSVLAVPIVAGRAVLGSINATSTEREAFDTVSQQLATVVAATTASLMLAAEARERAAHLRQQLAHTRQRTRGAERSRLRAAGEVRSGLMAADAALQLLKNRRSQLDASGQEALEVLSEELRWHEALSLEMLRTELPHPREAGAGRTRPGRNAAREQRTGG